MHDTAPDFDHLWRLIAGIKFAMFTAHHHNGHLHSRPMTTQNRTDDHGRVLWFFMSRSGDPVAELTGNPEVNVSYADPGKDAYVSISGSARVVEDMVEKKSMWNTFAEAWFPGGVDDPDLALVAVDIRHADYWDVRTNKMIQLIKMATAAVTGRPPKDMGEHAKLRMS